MIYQFDIETSDLSPWEGRVTMIGVSDGEEPTFFYNDDEKVLLQVFWQFVAEHKSDFFVGFNNLEFDVKFLVKRSLVQGIKPYLKFKYMNIDLRNLIDSDKYAVGTLSQICTQINGTHKWEDLKGSDVVKLFYMHDYETLKKYLSQDLALTKVLFCRLQEIGLIPANIKQPEVIQ